VPCARRSDPRARSCPLTSWWSDPRGDRAVDRHAHRRPPCASGEPACVDLGCPCRRPRAATPAGVSEEMLAVVRPCLVSSEELSERLADRSRRDQASGWTSTVAARFPGPRPPPELPPSGPPVVLGVGVVLVPVSPVAQGVSRMFSDEFHGLSVVHRMCTACPPRRVCRPQVVPRSVHRRAGT
jgi:hypothetical protein